MSICLYSYIYICLYAYIYICLYAYIYICLYAYMWIYLYKTVCDGMRWYTMVCNGMRLTYTMVYDGILAYTLVYNRLWYFYNVTFLQRDIFTTNLSSGKILLTLSYLPKFFVHDSFSGQ
jgi:hypothetical protein